MKDFKRIAQIAATVLVAVSMVGCATSGSIQPVDLDQSASMAWSLKSGQDEMIVAVSPARQTMQIAGASAALLGAGIDAVANAKHRKVIREALGDYAPGDVFEAKLQAGLDAAFGEDLTKVDPIDYSGADSRREAQSLRYKALAKEGHDTVLDLKMTYGLFGSDGTLVAKLDGQARSLPKGSKVWQNDIVVSAEPILADAKLSDPTKRLGPNLSNPRFTAEDDAVVQWAEDDGAPLRAAFEDVVDGVVSALLCDLGMAEDATGEYYLGKLAMNRKEFDVASKHFGQAIALNATYADALNGKAVKLAHQERFDEAIAAARSLTASHPEYGPTWYNLAWWLAMEKGDLEAAQTCYDTAMELGMLPSKKIEKTLAGE